MRPARVAIVIDDSAYSLSLIDGYAALGIPLTFAILPGSQHTSALARRATELGFAVILHCPMEPHGMPEQNPGSWALTLNMTPEAMRDQLEKNIAAVPGLVGVNNHMGSAFTENEQAMEQVLQVLKSRNLFFFDSRTSARSVGRRVARRIGVPALNNHTFLDNVDDVAAIEAQLQKSMDLALRYGSTTAIGHYRRKHLREALERMIPRFKERGIEFVALPALLPT